MPGNDADEKSGRVGICHANSDAVGRSSGSPLVVVGSSAMAATAPIKVAGLRRLATRIRLNALAWSPSRASAISCQAFSSAEIFAVLFGGDVIRLGHDRFVLSPGHYAICLYAVAAEIGLIDAHTLATYGKDGSELEAIGTERTPLVDLVCGSLGQGLSAAIGFALAAHLAGEDRAHLRVPERRRNGGRAGLGGGDVRLPTIALASDPSSWSSTRIIRRWTGR